MKIFNPVLNLASTFIVISVLSGCVKKPFDTPPVNIPHVDFPSNMTVAQLKSHFSGDLHNIGDTVIIGSDTIINPVIQGVVTANDESGNIYKTIYIQDNTGGILIALDRTNLYTTLKEGQRVYVKCSGMYAGKYGGLTQLGYIYNGSIGRLPDVMIDNHIFRDSLPGQVPATLNRTFTSLSGNDVCMLVSIDSVHFQDTGIEFADQVQSATDRILLDKDDNTLIVRTSKYANFASSELPKGMGSIKGILGIYNGTYQFIIRDLDDLYNWDTTAAFITTISEENFDISPTGWTIYSVASNKNWYWDATYKCMAVNGFGGDTPSEDWLISPAVNLTSVTEPVLSFRTWTKFTDSGIPVPLEAYVSSDYTGNPQTATWTQLNPALSPTNSQTWTASGDLSLASFTSTVYIGFKYKSSGTGSGSSSSWEVDAFKITGVQN